MREVRVLFVCLGNICRSPLAAVVFSDQVERATPALPLRFVVESCGTGDWHIGEQAHVETRNTLRRHGLDGEGHRARQLCADDFRRFDLVVAMDEKNVQAIEEANHRSAGRMPRVKKGCDPVLENGGNGPRLFLLREFDTEAGAGGVPDPYFGGPEGFEEVYQIVERCCRALLQRIVEEATIDAAL